MPPTERRGRVQTSTVTVAVIDNSPVIVSKLDESKIEWQTFCTGGPGGSRQNKNQTGVRAIYGELVSEGRELRTQSQNKKLALERLRKLYYNRAESLNTGHTNLDRRNQIGSGMRGDKIRTYREQDDLVIDHTLGVKTNLTKLKKGDWSKLK